MASGRQQRTGGIRASIVSDDHHGRDDSGRRNVTGPGKKYRGRVRMEPRLEGRRHRKEKEERSIQRL